jgi:DNA sulfur modification protein DndC
LTQSCATCLEKNPRRFETRIQLIAERYARSTTPWVLGYSGGKDSSAVLKLLYEALCMVPKRKTRVYVVYCDTGVEIPIVREHVRTTFNRLRAEAKADGVPVTIRIAEPSIEDRYFVKVIGRGYPPPTNRFRWCTDRLRINPIKRLLASQRTRAATIVVGTRFGESAERDRVLEEHKQSTDRFYFRQSGSADVTLFAPIVDFAVTDVWRVLLTLRRPNAVDGNRVLAIYRDAGAECPVVRDEHGTPCGAGRFGCWTCTVVRKDRAVTSLVEQGHTEMRPLLLFRNWLADVRDQPSARCGIRRNGTVGLGPLTISTRMEALRRLQIAERDSGMSLISQKEVVAIRRLWESDRKSGRYFE